MRRLAASIMASLLAGLISAPPVAAERLVVSLSANQIAIGTNYTGTQLALFGLIERDGQTVGRAGSLDAIVTVRGPRESLAVRRKEQVGPVWINRGQQKFVAVPAVLSVLSSRPIDEIADPQTRRRLRLGLRNIVNAPEFALDLGEEDDPFREALIRLRSRDGLWTQNGRDVQFVTDSWFRAPIPLPATAPTGNYDVDVTVLLGDTVLARRSASFEVVKTGFEEQITSMAQNHSLIYGLMLGVLSLMFGWIASVIFRRD